MTASQPTLVITQPDQFTRAMERLSTHGYLEFHSTPRHLLNIAEHFAETQQPESEHAARQVFDSIRAVPGDQPIEARLDLSGHRQSGFPFFSAVGVKYHGPTKLAEPSAQPSQRTDCMTGLPMEGFEHGESTDTIEPGQPISPETDPATQPHPHYHEARIRQHLHQHCRDHRIGLLLSLLTSQILDAAADNSREPEEFNQSLREILENVLEDIETRCGLH